MLVYSNGKALSLTLETFNKASKAARYMAAVRNFMQSNNPEYLKPFIGRSIMDINDREYIFETDPNALYRLAASGTESFEQVYRIVI